MRHSLSPKDIDAILPQTQCGLCGHGGCLPYAKALVNENADIDLCPPGGIPVLRKLGELLSVDATPLEPAMLSKAKPPIIAMIRESECIGCTKCIQVCPVDAIIGSAKSMHSVISDECTGCELCVPACPVDCIDLISDTSTHKSSDQFRNRYESREQRLAEEIKKAPPPVLPSNEEKQSYLKAALARSQHRNQSKLKIDPIR
jgi:electron transport complex protein RnfB